jgi:hypothetical protein
MMNEVNAGPATDGARVVDEVKDAASDVAEKAKDSVREVRDEVADRAAEALQGKKHAFADSLDALVHALHAAEQALRDDSQESLARYSGSLATYVERSTGYIRNNDMSGLMSDLQTAGRENTGMFMGSTFVAGAALGRFLRASSADSSSDMMSDASAQTGMSEDGDSQRGAPRTSPSEVLGAGTSNGGMR